LDAGTWLNGAIQESLARGSKRAFAVMSRLTTPQGCKVNFRAPIADQIGTAGIDGEVDTHFLERLKGVGALAMIDLLGQVGSAAATAAIAGKGSNSSAINFNQFQGGARQLGQGSFDQDANIPPTLSTHQGRDLVVTIMSDIDLRPCFRLRTIQ
jgi:type IV secretion system protein VirB10